MSFVYHGVPRGMRGDVLYPLNELARVAPSLHELQRAKYFGREAVLEFRVPGLDVLFNDTIHCAALHPHHLFAARRRLGLDPPARPAPPLLATGLAFEIPVERVVRHRVVWYSCKTLWVNGAPDDDVPDAPPADEFEPFDPTRYRELDAPPAAHIAYLERMRERGRPPLMFVHIPHILVAGPIDVSGLRVVAWDDPPTRT